MEYHSIGLLLLLCTYTSGWSPIYSTTTGSTTRTNSSFLSSTNSSGYYYDSSGFYNVSCKAAQTAFPSFTLVVDTSGSMYYYLYQLQDIIRVLSNRLDLSAYATRQYTLMEFNDPVVGPFHVTCSSTEFFNAVYYLYTHGGGDCQDYALTGLRKALEISPFGSFVVIVTDSSAKDSDDFYAVNQIYSLLDSLQVKVFIFAGDCGSIYGYDYRVYRDIAAYSYGHVFQVNYPSSNIADLFNFFLKIPVNSTTRLYSVDIDSYYYSVNFWVPTNLTSLIVSRSGSNSSLILYNPSGVKENLTTFFSESWGSVLYLQNPRSGAWTFAVYASGFSSLRIEGYKEKSVSGNTFNSSSFCSKCNIYAICKKDLFDYTCVCKNGFSGDGFSCYDIDECDYYRWPNPCNYAGYCVNTYGSYNCSCYYGYMLENKTCVDIDECSSPTLNNCDPLANCSNYYGSYSCYCPEGYYGNGSQCEIDECAKDVCGFGRECIKTTGSHVCSDPCFNYTTLNEPSRSTSYIDYYYYYYYYYYYGRSDYYLNGWYRFMGSGGVRLAEFCPSTGSCYTRYPMWLEGTHPQPSDGIVNSTVCTSDNGYCCQWTSDVKIKACPGGFYIYKFSWPPMYYSGYCTDPSTVPEYCSCSDDEECRAVGGRYRCYCKNDGSPALEDIRPVLSCGNQEIKASFLKCDLEKFNLNPKNIHLKDSSCVGFADFNSTNIISVVSILKNGVCGNELVNNNTHVIYKNTIYLSLDTNSSLGGEDLFSISYSCVYPLDMQLSLETAFQPFAGSVAVDMEGTGKLAVTMALYKDSSYSSPYEGSQVILSSKTNLYIGILLKIGDTSQYAVKMVNCYAAPSVNSTTKYDIIKNSCPSMQDSSINMIENGLSVKGRFSVQLFGYIKDVNIVYLFCDIHICNTACATSCTGVRALTATDSITTDASLVLGPIIRQDDPSASTPSAGGGAYTIVASLTTILLFLSGPLLLFF